MNSTTKRSLLFAAALLPFISLSAFANDLVLIGASNHTRFFLDKTSAVRTNGVVKIPYLAVLSEPTEKGLIAYNADTEIVCDTKQRRDVKTTYFYTDGRIRVDTKIEEWEKAKPKSVGEGIIDEACTAF